MNVDVLGRDIPFPGPAQVVQGREPSSWSFLCLCALTLTAGCSRQGHSSEVLSQNCACSFIFLSVQFCWQTLLGTIAI